LHQSYGCSPGIGNQSIPTFVPNVVPGTRRARGCCVNVFRGWQAQLPFEKPRVIGTSGGRASCPRVRADVMVITTR
jgi:hypothetical protein